MTSLVVSVDRSRVREGKLPELKAAMRELAAFVEANEPRAIAYSVHLDPDESHVTVVQLHPDSASMEYHLDVAAAMFPRFRDLLQIVSMDVYGRPSEKLLERMRVKGKLLGDVPVVVRDTVAGFARPPR